MPTIVGEETEKRAPLSIDVTGGVATAVIVRRFDKDQVSNYLEEYLDPTYVENVGLHVKKLRQHPDWDWLLLDSVEIDYDQPGQPPATDSANEPESGWIVTERYRGAVIQGGAIPASDPIYNVIPSGSWIEHYWSGSAQVLAMPGSIAIYVDDTGNPLASPESPPDVDYPVNIAAIQHTVIWRNTPAVNESNLLSCLGRINDADSYTNGGFTWRINRIPTCHNVTVEGGTLLFDSYEPRVFTTGDGFVRYDVTMSFTETVKAHTSGATTSYYGWNRFPRHGSDPPWTAVKTKGDAAGNRRYPYEKADFSKLFDLS